MFSESVRALLRERIQVHVPPSSLALPGRVLLRLSSLYTANTVPAQNTLCMEISACGELPTPLVNGQASRVYPINPVQYLYISCYVTANNQVLSYLLLRLLPHAGNKALIAKCCILDI
jgi:hypothetical protein